MNGFPETYSVDPESTGQRPHDQIDNLISEHEDSSLFNLLSFLTELAPGYSPLERMGEKETWLQKAGEVPTFLMGLGLLASPGGKVRKTATKLGTRRVLQEFGEEVADPLYHNTSLTNLVDILKEGHLKGAPALGRKHLPSKEGSGISFTRNPRLGTGEAKGTPGERLFQTKYGQAQIMVSKEGIENLGKITKHGPKELSQEVLFSPLKSETKRIQRLPKIPTEKFEGIHISEFMVEAQLPGREYDKATVQYITELMREAHKRKVPIILGPKATETFEFLGMDNKLPKAWLGRLVKNSGESKEFLPLFESGPRTRKAIEILDKKKSLGVEKKTGKKFWGIIVDPLDGEIEYAIPYSKASAVGFHHYNYMPGDLAEQVTTGEKVFLFLDEKLKGKKRPLAFVRDAASWGYERRGGISGELPSLALSPNTRLSQRILDRIYEQIEILPSSKSKLPGP